MRINITSKHFFHPSQCFTKDGKNVLNQIEFCKVYERVPCIKSKNWNWPREVHFEYGNLNPKYYIWRNSGLQHDTACHAYMRKVPLGFLLPNNEWVDKHAFFERYVKPLYIEGLHNQAYFNNFRNLKNKKIPLEVYIPKYGICVPAKIDNPKTWQEILINELSF